MASYPTAGSMSPTKGWSLSDGRRGEAAKAVEEISRKYKGFCCLGDFLGHVWPRKRLFWDVF